MSRQAKVTQFFRDFATPFSPPLAIADHRRYFEYRRQAVGRGYGRQEVLDILTTKRAAPAEVPLP